MEGKLKKGTRIEMLYGEAVVEEWLAEGGQGDVYRVGYNGEKKALKWYKPKGTGRNPRAFYENLKDNVMKGAPSKQFLWPEDISVSEPEDESFGYVMGLRPSGYHEVSEFMLARDVRFRSYATAVDAALNIVSAYRILHNKGYSYQDLNDGNFFIHPENGMVLIADNDNVAPDGKETGIIGKPRYMAPEIVLGKKMPDSLSDRYSMSVILFILFVLNHPLEGKHSLVPVLPPALQEKLYGSEALFIMDQDDKSNAPDPVIHRNALTVWPCLPDYMRELFSKAFSQQALKNPNARPTEAEWMDNLVRFRSEIVLCRCGNEVFTQDGAWCVCDNCHSTIRISYRLKFRNYSIPGIAGSRIYRCQLGPCNANEALQPFARVIAKKQGETLLMGIQNLSDKVWFVSSPNGKEGKAKKGDSIPLKNGICITVNTGVGTETIEIVENLKNN